MNRHTPLSPGRGGYGTDVGGTGVEGVENLESGADRGGAPLRRRWLPALAAAGAADGVADIVWVGDSISQLNATGRALPWHVGHILSGWTESTQYRNASGDAYAPSMFTTGVPTSPEDAGFGGWAVDLVAGQLASTEGRGEGVTVLWTSAPGGGTFEVSWGDEVLGATETAGDLRHSRTTTFRRLRSRLPETLSVACTGGSVRLEGVYVHASNLEAGVRVWPAVRSGNAGRHFLEHAGWMLDALDTVQPDLVVIATGTNDDDYPGELVRLIEAIGERAPEADLAVWLPPLTTRFTLERAAAGRQRACEQGWAVIDAAAALGALPTIDGVHPTSLTTAMAARHAAAVLAGGASEDAAGAAAMLVAQAVAGLASGQSWEPGVGVVSIESMLGATLLSGRLAPTDAGQAWALLPPELAQPRLGLPGVSLSFGPGGDLPIDAHLSRVGPGELAVNAGEGQVDAGRLLVREGGDPPAPVAAAVLFARSGAGGTELAVRLPDGSTHVVAGAGARTHARVVVPVPCSIAPHRRVGADVPLQPGTVVWLPFPALAAPASVTHVWIEVATPAVGAGATAAIVGPGPDGRPGTTAASTATNAIDLSGTGIRGAALVRPVILPAGERWWVAVHVDCDGPSAVARGGEDLGEWPTVQVGAAPVVPATGEISGALVLTGQVDIPERPGVALTNLVGPVPVVHVSLQAP